MLMESKVSLGTVSENNVIMAFKTIHLTHKIFILASSGEAAATGHKQVLLEA